MKSTILEHISHFEAQRMQQEDGAILIDIREPRETAREYIETAMLWPLSKMPNDKPKKMKPSKNVIFFCRSGNRTIINDKKLNGMLPNKAYILEGGIEAWRDGKLPTIINKKAPIEMHRQVFIAAGLLIMLGAGLSFNDMSIGYIIAGLVGAGLTLAGITGYCGMAKILQLLPHNKPAKN